MSSIAIGLEDALAALQSIAKDLQRIADVLESVRTRTPTRTALEVTGTVVTLDARS